MAGRCSAVPRRCTGGSTCRSPFGAAITFRPNRQCVSDGNVVRDANRAQALIVSEREEGLTQSRADSVEQRSMPSPRAGQRRNEVLAAKSSRCVCNGHHILLQLERGATRVRPLTAAKRVLRSRAGPARDRARHHAEDAVGTPVHAAPFFGGSACSRAALCGALRSARMNAGLQVGLAQQGNARMLEPMSYSWRMLRLFVLRSILIRPGLHCRQSIVSLPCLSFSHEPWPCSAAFPR